MAKIDVGEPSEECVRLDLVFSRADRFRAAHSLVNALPWGEGFTVYDVLKVAEFLGEETEEEN